tara:strand:- start:1477 stop:2025 length:549 start_codon:yes stop_codon:yes gene_type:complete
MGTRDKGWAVLAGDTTLYKIASSENLPCCTLVAMWCLDVAYAACETSVSRYANRDRDWWEQANVYDAQDPWSALTANQRVLGGAIDYCQEVKDEAPQLTPGHWHVVQRWNRLGLADDDLMEDDEVVNGSYGHTYLAYADPEEEGKVTIIQSSIKKGYRVNTGTWEGNAGLKGFSVGVLTLPA